LGTASDFAKLIRNHGLILTVPETLKGREAMAWTRNLDKKCLAQVLSLALALVFALGPVAVAQDAIPNEWAPWRDPKNPDVIVLKPDDKDGLVVRRDTSKDPKREPGLVNPQRYAGGVIPTNGFPTFLGAPLAFYTEDLKAGKVDVALVGLTIDDNVVSGARFAANKMRALTDWMPHPAGGTDNYTGVDYSTLTLADYGNIGAHFNQNQRSLEEIHKVIGEILAADTMPIAVGGTHVQAYGLITALAQKYGPKKFVVLHIDAHYDTYLYGFGRYVHNGSFLLQAIEKELINGHDLIQVGLRGIGPDAKSLKWMMDNKLRYHFQAEIERYGWRKVLERILNELKGKKVFISFDMDGLDPSYAPAVGTQETDGLTASQGMQLMRAVGIQNEVVAAEFNEYNPLLDDAHTTTGILMDRLIRSLLAGIAARKQGITDPLYLDPSRLDHGVDK
jgi:agmatinase